MKPVQQPLLNELDIGRLISRCKGHRVAVCPNPGNAGNALLTVSALDILHENGIPCRLVKHTDIIHDHLILYCGSDELSLEKYRYALPFFINNYRQNREIIILPHSVRDVPVPLHGINNLLMVCREPLSYKKLLDTGFDVSRIYICDDLMFSLKLEEINEPLPEMEISNSFSHPELWARDPEITYNNLDITGWWKSGNLDDSKIAKKIARRVLMYIYIHKIIRTDQAQIAILSARMNKKTEFYDDPKGFNRAMYDYSLSKSGLQVTFIDKPMHPGITDIHSKEKISNSARFTPERQYFQRLIVPGISLSSRAKSIAAKDFKVLRKAGSRRFSLGTRPVIRWVKGDGMDDEVTRTALAHATRLFKSEVDYCLCTNSISAERARYILSLAAEPVEWWPVNENDNADLARLLAEAGCFPGNFGYWWKWFPERVRPEGPEWILDGDMIVTRKPPWYEQWKNGENIVRVTQDDFEFPLAYGAYMYDVNPNNKLYSGLIALPPGLTYMDALKEVLRNRPLQKGHNGITDMSEQGVISATFQKFSPETIPLHQFPFARAFEEHLDFGLNGEGTNVWGYHFGGSFRQKNYHFERMMTGELLFSTSSLSVPEQFKWLGNHGQWGIPGWSLPEHYIHVILDIVKTISAKTVLEAGTSRGRLAAILSSVGCTVTTIDHLDRGASKNLEGLNVEVVIEDFLKFLEKRKKEYDLIIVDLHDNSEKVWKQRSNSIAESLTRSGHMLLNNASLFEIREWKKEKGVKWYLQNLPPGWKYDLIIPEPPGLALIKIK